MKSGNTEGGIRELVGKNMQEGVEWRGIAEGLVRGDYNSGSEEGRRKKDRRIQEYNVVTNGL